MRLPIDVRQIVSSDSERRSSRQFFSRLFIWTKNTDTYRMRSLVLLVATTAVVSGRREIVPGFAADFRSFDESSIYQQQRLPRREQARSFRETSQLPALHQLQSFRGDSLRAYRQPFVVRDEVKNLRQESKGGFNDDGRMYRDGNRVLEDELRNFNVDSRPFKDEIRVYKDDVRGFGEERPFIDDERRIRDGPRHFREERPFREELRSFRDESRPFKDESRFFKDESRPFKDESRIFKDESRFFKDESRPFKDESRIFKDESRHFKDESSHFKDESRPFKDESRFFKDESRPFRDEFRPFRDEIRQFEPPRTFRDEYQPYREEFRILRDERPFKEESVSYRNEPRPFREESQPFKDELLFTDESQSLAEAHNRFNKEHEHRQPLSFGGHSNYLKFGNHGLGFASVPTAILPLEDNNSQRASGIMVSTAATPQSPEFPTSAGQTSSTRESLDSKIQNSVTLPPDVRSTPSQSTSSNTIDNNAANEQRENENLFGVGSTSSASTAATISTSGGTNASPKVVFASGSASMSSPSMGITGAVGGNAVQPTDTPSVNSLHASKTSMHFVGTPSSYFPTEETQVPAALLNYIFKYQMPEKTKTSYTYRESLQPDSFNHIQTVPLVHHPQTSKYSILPEFKIPDLSAIRQPGGTINYVSAAQLPKVSYINGNQQALTLGTSYSNEVNYPRNFVQLDRGNHFSNLGQLDLQQIGQNDHFSHFGHIGPSNRVTQLGEYGHYQTDQTHGNPFAQGGLQLQLGGFSGIDYSALSSNSEGSRGSQGLEIGKVGLSLQEPARAPAPTFAKISFGQPLW